MLPYYAIASIVVLAFVVAITARAVRQHELEVASVKAHGTPSPPRRQAASTLAPESVIGDAPWALSAVPECFHQLSEAHGPAAFVSSHLPAEAKRLAPGSVVAAEDCRLTVGATTLSLERGTERLIVPAEARAYAIGEDLAVLRLAGAKSDLRVYRRVSGPGP